LTFQMVQKVTYPQGGSTMCYLPACIDSAGNTIAAGFQDGVFRIISDTKEGVNLQYLFKPHRSAITNICISQDGTFLLTGSEDKTIFFFSMTMQTSNLAKIPAFTKYSVVVAPIGFINLECQVSSISISPEDNISRSLFGFQKEKGNKSVGLRILVNLMDGKLLSGLIPNGFSFNSTNTYEIPTSLLHLIQWTYDTLAQEQSVVITTAPVEIEEKGSRPNSSDSQKAPEPVAKAFTKEVALSLNSIRKADGLLLQKDSKISAVYFLKLGYFLAAIINKKEECEIRLCHVLTPTFSKLVTIGTEKIATMRINKRNTFILIGTVNGATSIIKFNLLEFLGARPANEHETYSEFLECFTERIENHKISIKKLMEQTGDKIDEKMANRTPITGQQWIGHAHDLISGNISGIQTSFDDSFLITSGTDGGIFVWNILTEAQLENPAITVDLKEQSDYFNCPPDIFDPNSYSIQESKMKLEKDKEVEVAEGKKQIVRNSIQELRNEFLTLLAKNEKFSVDKRGSISDLSVDPFLERDIELEKKEKLSNLYKELAWNSEREAIAPRKLKQKFLDPLQQELIEISAIGTRKSVSTFRHLHLDDSIKKYLQSLYSVQTAESNNHQTNQTHRPSSFLKETNDFLRDEHDFSQKRKGEQTSGNKLEIRKKNRAIRAEIWKELMECKPDENYEDPRDISAIRHAQSHMGDYKLKSAENYIVPDNERIDADKKQRQFALLRESVNKIQETFNNTVVALRDKKVMLIALFKENIQKINYIDMELKQIGADTTPFEWNLLLEESAFPENRYLVSSTDIANHQLLDAELLSKENGDDGMFFANNTSAPPTNESELKIDTNPIDDAEVNDVLPKNDNHIVSAENIEINAVEIHNKKIKLTYDRDSIINTIKRLTIQFDHSVESLHQERAILESGIFIFNAYLDLKAADVKLLLLLQEWILLKEFEKFDNALSEKLDAKRAEKLDIDSKIDECQDKLGVKKEEIEGVIQKEKQIHAEFTLLLGENNKNEEYITKIYKRKIKRTKVK
jgi:WD40 repeat protein